MVSVLHCFNGVCSVVVEFVFRQMIVLAYRGAGCTMNICLIYKEIDRVPFQFEDFYRKITPEAC